MLHSRRFKNTFGGERVQNRAIDSRFRNTIVCIDSYEEKVLYGRMYNPYIEGEIPFRSAIGFIEAMEGMLEQMNFPQAYEEKVQQRGKRRICSSKLSNRTPGKTGNL